MAYLSYLNALGACEGQSELGVVLYFALEVSFAEIRDGHQEAKNTTTYLDFLVQRALLCLKPKELWLERERTLSDLFRTRRS